MRRSSSSFVVRPGVLLVSLGLAILLACGCQRSPVSSSENPTGGDASTWHQPSRSSPQTFAITMREDERVPRCRGFGAEFRYAQRTLFRPTRAGQYFVYVREGGEGTYDSNTALAVASPGNCAAEPDLGCSDHHLEDSVLGLGLPLLPDDPALRFAADPDHPVLLTVWSGKPSVEVEIVVLDDRESWSARLDTAVCD